jgi:hypothetical protein
LRVEDRRDVPVIEYQTKPLAAGGFATATPRSIDAIRAQLKDMEVMNQQRRALAQAAVEEGRPGGEHDHVSLLVRPEYSPSDGAMASKIEAHYRFQRRRLFCDAEEVVRKERVHVEKYLQLLTEVSSGQLRASPCREALTRFTALLDKTMEKLNTNDDGPALDVIVAEALDSLSDADLVCLWKAGLIDEEWLLRGGPSDGAAHAIVEKAAATIAVVDALKDDLKGAPPEDISHIMERAQNRQFEGISLQEIEALEAYEKANSALRVRALAPENSFLALVAPHDEKIQMSLDILEKTKRAAFNDEDFQSALSYIHHLEEQAMGNVGRLPVSPRRSAAEVPYFFADFRSVVPPQGRSNLPPPKPSVEEKNEARRRLKKLGLRRRYFR